MWKNKKKYVSKSRRKERRDVIVRVCVDKMINRN